ncbi:cryptochrome/photolyase family protein [Rhizobium paknamense]|uniref:Deoxyribodipyrimidine photo-lyase n=1 Tax=Rhizobium paknamense TaxID=1206817 RepID=A0ABU0I6Q2_9HYPH|nr:deoxyribodipyrimidine photo-lyase [Rhizobium paknamense]MDQ0453898.1 deoxyribodipyrimidine photo-lyase [Rhizobium paknamense]
MQRSSPTILWFRKDLRLSDNHALSAAVARGGPVIQVFILEPEDGGTGPMGSAQRWWLHHSLSALSKDLETRGSRLILRRGDAQKVLEALVKETGAEALHWNRRYEPVGMDIDGPLKQHFRDAGLTVESFGGQLLHEPTRLKTTGGTPFRVYTPFWKAVDAGGDPTAPIDAPKAIAAPDRWPDSEALDDWALLPTKPDWAGGFREMWTPGEAGAHQRLKHFISKGLRGYRRGRDFPAEPHVSMLSPHIALGEISPAQIWHATIGLPASVAAEDYVHFRKELVWRDFSYHLLFHFPELPRRNWNARFDDFPWRDNKTGLRAWQKGRTGYPIVDAAMRQLWQHGYMHNRLRMITASFLIKDLMVDWRDGEAWFADTLVDADPASNAASWQWVAGSGADAAPFFRIFNPITQGEKFDPEGTFVRRYLPELAKLPNEFIHKPFEAPEQVLRKAGVVLGETYPQPIVDHRKARETALSAYQEISAGAKSGVRE